MVNKDSQYHEVLSELSRYRTGILCGIKNDYHAGKVSQLLDSATRLFEECHKAYQECERAANAMETASTAYNSGTYAVPPIIKLFLNVQRYCIRAANVAQNKPRSNL
jgi:hypothetical protein